MEKLVKINLLLPQYIPANIDVSLILPDGIVSDKMGARAYCDNKIRKFDTAAEFTLTATEFMAPFERVIVEATMSDRPMPIYFAIPIIAK